MVYTTVHFFNMVFVAEWLKGHVCGTCLSSQVRILSNTQDKIYTVMVKKIKGNVVKCYRCGSMLKYDDADIEKKECSYGVQSYAGETYIGKFITCPQCGDRIEVS